MADVYLASMFSQLL